MVARGRPIVKKKEPPNDLELKIADYINKYLCSVPGCVASIHVEDARNLLEIIEANK